MTLANPSQTTEISIRPENSHPSIRAKLDAATMALLQTRDQVIKSLDKHLSELHSLRLALAESDNATINHQAHSGSATSAQPRQEPIGNSGHTLPRTKILLNGRHDMEQAHEQPAPQPPRDMLYALQGLQNALLQKSPLTPPPRPMSEVFPDHLTEVQAPFSAPTPPPLAAHSFSLPSVPAPAAEPTAAPLPPQFPPASPFAFPFPAPHAQQPFLHSHFHQAAAPEQMPQTQHPFTLPPTVSHASPAPMPAPAMDGWSLFSSPPPAPAPTAFHQDPMLPSVAGGISADVAREARIDSQMEQATLADLNAALAFAFSQVSSPSQPLHSPMTTAVHQPHREAPQQAAHPQWHLPQRA
jgi:hypothetical protein